MNIPDARSGIAAQNLEAILAASALSAKATAQTGQQQYSTPPEWAAHFATLLPDQVPDAALDPQCAGGNLLRNVHATYKYGWDIDARHNDAGSLNIERNLGSCVTIWGVLDELFPDLRFPCQVANPPFGIKWRVPVRPGSPVKVVVDSTEYTWKKIIERAAPGGHGYFICARPTMERLKLQEHPWVYLYQTFPVGFFPKTEVEVGVIHWHNSEARFKPSKARSQQSTYIALDFPGNPMDADRLEIRHQTLEGATDHELLAGVRLYYRTNRRYMWPEAPEWPYENHTSMATVHEIIEEERGHLPPFNVWLGDDGSLKVHLSVRFATKRRFTSEQVVALEKLRNCHPLTLTTEAESRRLLRSLLQEGLYTIEPAAAAAIAAALLEVETLAVPIMPVTEFERVAYVDDLEELTVRSDYHGGTREGEALPNPDSRASAPPPSSLPVLTPGAQVKFKTSTYTFTQSFVRPKAHFNEDTQKMEVENHQCELSGQDRYVAIRDNYGYEHRFMDKPRLTKGEVTRRLHQEHAESLLWTIFCAPPVLTIAEQRSELVKAAREKLASFQTAE